MTLILRTYINEWLLKAEHDLISAERLLDIEPLILDNACFHCRQAVEKSLKAYICYNGKDIEKTHDIIYLLSECSNFDTVFKEVIPLNINAYAVLGRYPDSNLMPEIEEARNFYRLAIQVNNLGKVRIIFPD